MLEKNQFSFMTKDGVCREGQRLNDSDTENAMKMASYSSNFFQYVDERWGSTGFNDIRKVFYAENYYILGN